MSVIDIDNFSLPFKGLVLQPGTQLAVLLLSRLIRASRLPGFVQSFGHRQQLHVTPSLRHYEET